VITRDVEADALAVTRPETLKKQGWATTFRATMQARKAAK
jgi:bifunctional UDP-N-acetylglucosamine pyrophosphorylase/glucosamine-1-phosphate N-acetyltransferase